MAAVLPLSHSTLATATDRAAATPPRSASLLGKYREIVIAVAFFLLFDIGVLVLNFYTSFKIDQDTVAINLAGRQRYVSQRIARTLLELDAAHNAGLPFKAETLTELRNGAKIWQASHMAFREGGTVPGGDGKPVYLEAVTSPRGRELEAALDTLWAPYFEKLQPLIKSDSFSEAELAEALSYSQANNIKLLNTANDFVTETQALGASRASTLRMVQTGGVLLALANFVFILFKFLRRLKTSDAAIEAANDENREILQSVREGLFLLTPELKIGSQISNSVHTLFGRHVHPDDNLLGVLQPLVSDKVLSEVRDYIELLFSAHVKEQLVQGINPLSELEIHTVNRLGQPTRRHLSFHFNRVMQGDSVRHLLVTVQDISQRMELESRLASERSRAQKEFGMFLKAFEVDPALLRQFVERAEASLIEVNDQLRSTSTASSEAQVLKAVDNAYRRIHAFKGDAASLGLEVLSNLAHQFETELQKLKDSGSPSGEALLALPIPLEDLLNKMAAFKALTHTRPHVEISNGPHPLSGLEQSWTQLANNVAQALGKRVLPQVHLTDNFDANGPNARWVIEIAQQFIRNAVAHGIESPSTRTSMGKSPEGRLAVTLQSLSAGEFVLSVRDDGMGLSVERIRQRLLDLRWYSPRQIVELSDQQILEHIFKPGFSMEREANAHAGRGIGLDLVAANIARLGARLNVSTLQGQFTEFRVRFS